MSEPYQMDRADFVANLATIIYTTTSDRNIQESVSLAIEIYDESAKQLEGR